MKNVKEFCGKAAEVLRSSERMVQRNVELWRETPETDGKYYNPDWDVHLDQEEVSGLLRNLKDAADFFEILSKNSKIAADLLAAHMAEEGGDE